MAFEFIGFTHSTFAFQQEAAIHKSEIKGAWVKPGTLIAFLQKGLQYTEVEAHINEVGLNNHRMNLIIRILTPSLLFICRMVAKRDVMPHSLSSRHISVLHYQMSLMI